LQDSAGNHHGTNNGATLTVDRCGRPDRAYAFNGQGQYISVNDAATLRPANITFSIWIRNGTTGVLMGKNEWAGSRNEMYALRKNAGQPYMIFDIKRNSNGVPYRGWHGVTAQYSANSWDHFVATWDSQILRSYLNGQPVNTNANAPAGGIDNLPGGPIEFGRWQQADAAYVNGALDDIRIYNRALSAQEVLALYNLEKCPDTPRRGNMNGSCYTIRNAFRKGKVVVRVRGMINRRGQVVSPGNVLKTVSGAPARFSLRSYRS
jgi:hypothetical protein